MKMFKKISILSFAILFAACGSNTEKKEEKEIKLNSTPKVEETKSAKEEGVTKVRLTGNDQMKYNLSEIRVNAGDKVELTLEHVGKMSVETMGHNFVLLAQGTNMQEFGAKAVEFKDNNYIPESTDNIIVHTKMLGGGEKTTITFDAPEKGEYDFICSFPGHLALMKGKFIVE